MPLSARFRRSTVCRLALVLAAVAQVAVAFLAPAAEARADRSMHAHIEAAGTRLHHAHVETLCPACSAQHLASTPPGGRAPAPVARHTAPRSATGAAAQPRNRFEPTAPRGPPLSL